MKRRWFLQISWQGNLVAFARADAGIPKEKLFSETPLEGQPPSEIVEVEEILVTTGYDSARPLGREE